jgi:WD40 repeat protein
VTTIAHAGAVSALHVLELTPADSAASSSLSAVVASGGHDATVRLWRVRAASAAASAAAGAAPTKRSLAVQQYAELNGARAPLRAARIDPSGRFIAGGDSGGNVFVWSAEAPAAEPSRDSAAAAGAGAAGPRSSKRARTRGASEASDAGAHGAGAAVAAPSSSSAASASAITVVTRDPAVVLLAAHRGAATGVAWLSSASFATCGLDGAIRIWELQEGEAGEDGASSAAAGSAGLTCVPTTTLSSGKAALAITASPLGALLATAHADGCVRVWDSRGRAAEGSAAEAGDEAVTVRADGLRAVLPVHATTLKASAAGGYAVTSAAGGSGKKVAPAAATDAPGSGAHDADSTWVSSVSWCPSSGHHVAAGSFSGAVSVWDTRSPSAPLFTLQPHAAPASALAGKGAGAAASGPVPAKALCVAWAGAVEEAAAAAGSGASAAVDTVSGAKQLVVSGGSDKQVRCSVFPAVLK